MSGEQMFLGIRLQLDASGVVTGAALASNSLAGIENSARRTGSTFNSVTDSMMTQSLRITGTLGAIAMAAGKVGTAIMNNFLAPSVEQAKTFEREMSQLKFVTNGTAEEMARLRGIAIKTGVETQFSPQESAAAIRMLKAAGLETDVALKSLNATLDVVTGSAGLITLEEGATATAAALLKFVNTGESAAKIMDVFAESTRETNMQMGDLAPVIDSMRDAPSKLNLTAAEAFGLAGVMRSAGQNTRSAGQNVAMFADRLILAQRRVGAYLRHAGISEEQLFDPSYFDDKMPEVAYQFKRLGVHIFETNGDIKNATKLLMELADRGKELKGLSHKDFVETISAILGPKSSAVLSALMNFKKGGEQGAAAFKSLIKVLDNSTGVNRQAAAAIEETTIGMEKFIQGTEETLAVIQGSTFLPALHKYYKLVRGILNTIVAYTEVSPNFNAALGTTAVIMYGLSKVTMGVAAFLAIAVAWAFLLGPALSAAGAGALILAAAVTVLKFALIGIAVVAGTALVIFAAISAGIYLWGKIWDKNATGMFLSLQNFFKRIKLVWKSLVSLFTTGELSEALYEQLKKSRLLGIVVAIYQIRTRLLEIWLGIKKGFKAAMIPIMWVLFKIGLILGWVIDKFSELMSWFTGSDLRDSISAWRTLGYVIGVILAIGLSAFIVTAIANIAALTTAVLGLVFAFGWLPVLVLAAIAAILYFDLGGKLGEWIYDSITAIQLGLLDMWSMMKNWGGLIAEVFVSAFKGNFDPLLAYISSVWEVIKNTVGLITGGVSLETVKASMNKIGLGISDSQRLSNEISAGTSRESTASDGSSLGVNRVKAQTVSKSPSSEYLDLMKAASRKGGDINIQKIELATQGKSPEEAKRLAVQMMEEILRVRDNSAEVEFSQ